MTCLILAHWASENEKLLVQKEILLVLGRLDSPF